MKVDFYRHGLSRADADAVADVLASPFLTTGKVARRVEADLCSYFDVPHAILVNSWTSGATATLMAMGIGPGDEVIVPAMTFVATANVVEMVGATTVLVDVDPNTFLLTPDVAASALTSRTKAVIPVHLYGQMVDIAAVRRAVDARAGPSQRVCILEDCAHCFEGTLNGERPGRHSDAACFSFYATKSVTCGEGGAIILRNADLHGRILETRLHGMTATAVNRFAGGRYNHWDVKRLGIKATLPDLLAALLPEQIRSVDERLRRRREVARRYDEALAGGPFRMLGGVAGCNTASHLYAIGIPSGRRDEAIAIMNEAGIGVTVNYRALPDLTYYRDRYPRVGFGCPHATLWGQQTLSLPHYADLPVNKQDHVVRTLLDQVAAIA